MAVPLFPVAAEAISRCPNPESSPTCAAKALAISGVTVIGAFPWVALRPVIELAEPVSGETLPVVFAKAKILPWSFCISESKAAFVVTLVPSAFILSTVS